MELYTQRLILTPCYEKSLSKYNTKEYKLRPHIAKYLEELKKDESIHGWGVWLVIDKSTNQIIGDIGFKGKPNIKKSVEIGYSISSSERNKGYATESLRYLIDWAFNSNSVEKITAECEEHNYPSIQVLEKLTMQKTKHNNGMLYWQLTNNCFYTFI